MRNFNISSEIRAGIRRAFRISPWHKEALRRARAEGPVLKKDGTLAKRIAVSYECAECLGLFKVHEVEVHHVEPVGPAPWTRDAPKELTWDTFIHRVFCPQEHLAVLCRECHLKITNEGRKRAAKSEAK